jgi:DNA-binding transcriptional LysR family regulator
MRRLDEFNIFMRVVERRSFVAAARQLGLPAPTVSRTMRQLEARLGAELLRRTTRQVTVTETGQMVYEAAARGIAALEEAEQIAQLQSRSPSGTLKILAPYGVGHLTLEPLLHEFWSICPNICLALTLNNEAVDIVAHGFDVAFRCGPLKDSSYAMRPLLRCPYRLVAAPSYLCRMSKPRLPSELPSHAFLGSGEPQAVQDYTFRHGQNHAHVKLKPWLLCNDVTVVLNQALGGSGIAVLPELVARSFVNSGKLISILSDWEIDDDFRLSIVFSPNATHDQKVRTFIDFIVARFRVLPANVDGAIITRTRTKQFTKAS